MLSCEKASNDLGLIRDCGAMVYDVSVGLIDGGAQEATRF